MLHAVLAEDQVTVELWYLRQLWLPSTPAVSYHKDQVASPEVHGHLPNVPSRQPAPVKQSVHAPATEAPAWEYGDAAGHWTQGAEPYRPGVQEAETATASATATINTASACAGPPGWLPW